MRWSTPELLGHALGMTPRAVGEDEPPPGKALEAPRRAPALSGTGGEIDVVHVFEKRVRIELVHLHEPGQRGAVLPVVALLQMARVSEAARRDTRR